jgi:hypothetical protein
MGHFPYIGVPYKDGKDATVDDVKAALPDDVAGLTVDDVLGYPAVNFTQTVSHTLMQHVREHLRALGFEAE